MMFNNWVMQLLVKVLVVVAQRKWLVSSRMVIVVGMLCLLLMAPKVMVEVGVEATVGGGRGRGSRRHWSVA